MNILDFFEIFFHSLEIDRKWTIFLYMQIFLHIFNFLAGNAPKNVHFCVRCKNAIKNACFFAPHSSKIHVLLLYSPPQAKFFENRRKNYHFLLIFYSIFGLRPKTRGGFLFARRAYCVGTLKNPCVCVRSSVSSFVSSSAAFLDRFWSTKMEIPRRKRSKGGSKRDHKGCCSR